jgi:hypothetical protein
MDGFSGNCYCFRERARLPIRPIELAASRLCPVASRLPLRARIGGAKNRVGDVAVWPELKAAFVEPAIHKGEA